MDAAGPQALEHVKVLELAGCEGEYCGKLLADLGADVIKVEPPQGSPCRREPPFVNDQRGPERSLHFLYFNANKRGITADLDTAQGRERVLRLAQNVDVLIESAPPGSLSEIGLGYDDLRRINSRLIYTSITGFGQSGPYRDYRANNLVAFAMGGLMYVSGKPMAPPVNAPGQQAHLVGAAHAAMAILIALWHVRHGGQGQHLDVSMFDCLAAMENLISRSANVGGHPRREGSQHRFATPGTIYRCRDGFVHMFVTNSQVGSWERFLDWLGKPEALAGAEFKDSVYRRKHVAVVDRVVGEFVRDLPKQTVFEALQARHIPCAPVNTPLDFVRDEHVRARGFVIGAVHPQHGRMEFPGPAFKIDSWRLRKHAPAIGEDNEAILGRMHLKESAPAHFQNALVTMLSPSALPLSGIRIADFTHMVAGPYGTMQLAYFGAEVIKVESTVRPDLWRIREGNKDVEASLPFADHNKNKLSVTLNLKSAEGRELARRLIARSDVVVENFSAGVMERFGLAYDDLKAIKPNIIMIRLQGLGSSGPRKDYVSWGPSLMPFAGVSHLWNHPDDGAPVGSQTSYPDYIVSIHMAYVLLAALHQRQNTGTGQLIDIAQSEVTASLIGPALLDALVHQRVPQPLGNRSETSAPHGCYPCLGDDEWCVISVADDDEWTRFCRATDNEALRRDGRFVTVSLRVTNRDALDVLISSWTRARGAQEVMEILQRAGVKAGRVSNGTMLAKDAHLRARGSIIEQEHPRQGRLTLPGVVVKFSQTPGELRRHAPLLGQDNDYVLQELLGLSAEEIRRLREAGAF
ncbi:MAG: CoA transferase [Deltaproteobacteria bacterium]|nr:CoA transferase [Deltaproteobacteria bacterium]